MKIFKEKIYKYIFSGGVRYVYIYIYIYKSLYRVESVAKTTRGYEKVQGFLQEEAEEKQRWVIVYR